MVQTYAPPQDPLRGEQIAEFKERCFEVFSENYYDDPAGPAGEWPVPDPEAADSPHFPSRPDMGWSHIRVLIGGVCRRVSLRRGLPYSDNLYSRQSREGPVMSKITRTDVPVLLQQMPKMGSYGRAESEPDQDFLRRFLPLPEHARTSDPDVILIIGDRVAGKTELFRAIQFKAGLEAIQKLGSGRGRLPRCAAEARMADKVSPQRALPLRRNWFSGNSRRERSLAVSQLIWLGLLLRCLQ